MGRHLTLMCVQPCHIYYAWQVEVMLHNFASLGIHIFHEIHCLFAIDYSDPQIFSKIKAVKQVEDSMQGVAKFFYYEDTRQRPVHYQPSIRPHILKQHFEDYEDLKDKAIFYHDCDIVFTKYPDFFDRMIYDENWYVSNTISYIGHDYILQKGVVILQTMCDIVKIDPALVKKNQLNSGGAQYVMKNVDAAFFEKMEQDCEKLHYEITQISTNIKQADKNYHELQIWCADMWAILWGAWIRGYETIVDKDMSFCWATDPIAFWENNYIYHNAGVVNASNKRLFFKGAYRLQLPYDINLEDFGTEFCSYRYCEEITKTKPKSAINV